MARREQRAHNYSIVNSINQGTTIMAEQTNNLIEAYNRIYANTFDNVSSNSTELVKQIKNSTDWYTWKELYKKIENLRTTYPEKSNHTYSNHAGCDGGCRGLCSGCYGGCSSTCTGGCSGCGNNCTGSCSGGCGSNCTGSCWALCSTGCEGGCNGCTDICTGCTGFSYSCIPPGGG